MITMNEILMGRVTLDQVDKETRNNLNILLERINKLRRAYAKAMKVNDGFRRPQDQPAGGATLSNHFKGLAIDIDDDEKGTLWKWVFENRKILAEIGLWCEHPCWTHHDKGTWMHFQIVPPKSGKRFYVPSEKSNPNPKFWDGKYEPELDSTKQP